MTKAFDNAVLAVKPNGMDQESIIPSSYDMSMEDLTDLVSMTLSSLPDARMKAITFAFYFGFVMGNRCTHSRKMKRL